jgi:hypothetical protein
MSGYGAFESEMSTEANIFFEAVRTEYARPLDPKLEADLVRRAAAEARAASATAPALTTPTTPGRRLALPARIAFVTGAILVGTTGLAVAGVGLPGPVDSVFERAGIDLPNQASDNASEPATPTSAPAGKGENAAGGADNGKHKAKGHDKNKAQGKAKGHDKQPGVPNGNAYGQSGGAPGNSENAPGQTKSSGHSSGGNGKANGHSKPPPGSRGKGHSK